MNKSSEDLADFQNSAYLRENNLFPIYIRCYLKMMYNRGYVAFLLIIWQNFEYVNTEKQILL